MSVQTPNMNLIQPAVGIDSGLTWENSANANSSTLDGHNHTPGYGVQVPSAGININAPLGFNNQPATNIQAVTFAQQGSLSTLNSLFVGTDGNLYFNDGAADPSIQMTLGGAVNASSSGIVSGTASAAFSSGVLVVLSAALTPANIQGASILLGNNVASSKYLTLAPPSSMGANYSVTLPAPNGTGTTAFVTMDTGNNMQDVTTVDNSSIVINSNVLEVGPQGVQQSMLAPRPTGTTESNGGIALSASCGAYTNSTQTPSEVTNFSVTLTTTGRPVLVTLIPDANSAAAFIEISGSPDNGAVAAILNIYRGSTYIGGAVIGSIVSPSVTTNGVSVPVGSLMTMDFVSAGTYTYTVQAYAEFASQTVSVLFANLMAYEI